MRVGIDIDGVTLDLHSQFRDVYQLWFDAEIGEFQQWDDMIDLTHFNDHGELWDWCDRAGVFHDLPWVPGAPGAIDHLFTQRHSIAFVTSRTGAAADAARYWHLGTPWYWGTQLVTDLGNSKHTVPCSVYIDDSPHVIEGLLNVGRKVIKFNRPWNRDVECDMAADTWDEVLDWLETMP
jgi:hypothetical protein